LKASKGVLEIAVVFLVAVSIAAIAYAQPNGAENVNIIKSERMQPKAGASVPAQAGNVTELNINATSVTKSWQGYFGNVTGTLTLDNADNLSMYQWDLASPQGEVYASPAQISDWSTVKCFNYTAHSPELNLTEIESSLNMDANDVDGVNETFDTSFTGSFYVGATLIDSTDGCHAVYTFVNDQPQSSSFVEVLLTDTTDIIYTAILEQDFVGFDQRPHDFQMIVGEDGHNGDTTTTPYYFYVELE
jgi:hypothetical protein